MSSVMEESLRGQLRQTQKNESDRLFDLREELKSKEQTIARLSRENHQTLEAQEEAQRAESELCEKLQEAEAHLANALAAQAAEFETEMEGLRVQLQEHLYRQQQRQQTDSKISREELEALRAQLHRQSTELQSLQSQLQQQGGTPFDPKLYSWCLCSRLSNSKQICGEENSGNLLSKRNWRRHKEARTVSPTAGSAERREPQCRCLW